MRNKGLHLDRSRPCIGLGPVVENMLNILIKIWLRTPRNPVQPPRDLPQAASTDTYKHTHTHTGTTLHNLRPLRRKPADKEQCKLDKQTMKQTINQLTN